MANWGHLLRPLLSLLLVVSSLCLSTSSAISHGRKVGQPHRDEDRYLKVAVAATPAILLLLFGVLCPCFRPKRREVTEQQQPVQEETASKHAKFEPHGFKIASGSGTGSGIGSFDPIKHQLRLSGGGGSVGMLSPFRPSSPGRFSPSSRAITLGSLQLTLSQIAKATHNFSDNCKIGEGEFALVYKAELQEGLVVAVKRAKKTNAGQRNEFINEVKFLSQIEHQNLVKLLCYIDERNEQLIISEYLPNGNLREHLDGHYGLVLDFSQRLQIAIDVAHGLTHLHQYAEKTIIHRDVKSSNILLMEGLRAKVADFGFARAGPSDGKSHIVTDVRGTLGYTDPQHMLTGKLTTMSDVFSYGVLLLEIASGRHPLEKDRGPEEKVTVRWAFKKYTSGRMREIMDPAMEEEVHGEVISKFLGLAFDCAAPISTDRPTMDEVVRRLWSIRKEYSKSRSG